MPKNMRELTAKQQAFAIVIAEQQACCILKVLMIYVQLGCRWQDVFCYRYYDLRGVAK